MSYKQEDFAWQRVRNLCPTKIETFEILKHVQSIPKRSRFGAHDVVSSKQNYKKFRKGFHPVCPVRAAWGGDFILKQTTIDEKEATYSQTKVVSRYMKTESMSGATWICWLTPRDNGQWKEPTCLVAKEPQTLNNLLQPKSALKISFGLKDIGFSKDQDLIFSLCIKQKSAKTRIGNWQKANCDWLFVDRKHFLKKPYSWSLKVK